MKNNVVETIIGGVVIAIAVVFFSYVYTTADIRAGGDGYEVTARFTSVDGGLTAGYIQPGIPGGACGRPGG